MNTGGRRYRRMRRRYAVAVLVAIVVLGTFGAVAAAAGTGQTPAVKAQPGIRQVIPDLTEDQLLAIAALEQGLFARGLELRTAMFTRQFELRQLRLAPIPDETAIANKRAELRDLREDMQELNRERREGMRAILTEAQLDALRERAQARTGPDGQRRRCRKIRGQGLGF